jgi:hypothetical protein
MTVESHRRKRACSLGLEPEHCFVRILCDEYPAHFRWSAFRLSEERAAMSDDGLEHMRAAVQGAEGRLQELVATSSIDFLGSSTRSYMDKCLLVSSIGVLVSTVGKLDPSAAFGPVKFLIEAAWVVPSAVLFSIVFYALGLFLLAQADQRRWNATYSIKNAEMLSLMLQLRASSIERYKRYEEHVAAVRESLTLQNKIIDEGCKYEQPLLPDPVPELVEHGKEVEAFNASIAKLAKQVSQPGIQLRRHLRQQWGAFVVLPLLFAAIAFILCVISIGRALHTAGSAIQA